MLATLIRNAFGCEMPLLTLLSIDPDINTTVPLVADAILAATSKKARTAVLVKACRRCIVCESAGQGGVGMCCESVLRSVLCFLVL